IQNKTKAHAPKIRSWNKRQEKEEERKSKKYVSSSSSDDVGSYRSHERDKHVKGLDKTKAHAPKIRSWNKRQEKEEERKSKKYELKVYQNLECSNYEDLIKVKLIALSFEGYTLVWWNEIALQI
ncbi:hypothetical protein CR513_21806, partial [Mucuna pruriens]